MKFSIYKKSKKFFWTTEIIIYIIIFSSLVLGYITEKTFGDQDNLLRKVFIGITLLAFFAGLVNKMIGFTKTVGLEGVLEGYITFKIDSIEIENTSYTLEEIKRIEIYNEDYSGKLVYTSSGNLGKALSNGTNNHITLTLVSGAYKKVYFEMINSNDFQNVRNELINYHINSKIDFWSLAHILGEKSPKETSGLTEEIKKHSR